VIGLFLCTLSSLVYFYWEVDLRHSPQKKEAEGEAKRLGETKVLEFPVIRLGDFFQEATKIVVEKLDRPTPHKRKR